MRNLAFAILWAAFLCFSVYKYRETKNQFTIYNELTKTLLYSQNIKEEYEFFKNKNYYNQPAQKKLAKQLYIQRQREYKIYFLKKAKEYWKVQFIGSFCEESSIADNLRIVEPLGYLIQALVQCCGLSFILWAIQKKKIKIVFKTESNYS
jgi:hypothetical protein